MSGWTGDTELRFLRPRSNSVGCVIAAVLVVCRVLGGEQDKSEDLHGRTVI